MLIMPGLTQFDRAPRLMPQSVRSMSAPCQVIRQQSRHLHAEANQNTPIPGSTSLTCPSLTHSGTLFLNHLLFHYFLFCHLFLRHLALGNFFSGRGFLLNHPFPTAIERRPTTGLAINLGHYILFFLLRLKRIIEGLPFASCCGASHK